MDESDKKRKLHILGECTKDMRQYLENVETGTKLMRQNVLDSRTSVYKLAARAAGRQHEANEMLSLAAELRGRRNLGVICHGNDDSDNWLACCCLWGAYHLAVEEWESVGGTIE